MKKKIKLGDEEFEVEIEEVSENLLKIKINEKDFFFSLANFEPKILKKEELIFSKEAKFVPKEGKGLGQKEIRSPLPGQVSVIFVKEGQEIKVNEKLLNLISMKMENEILSPVRGKIKEIKVKEGQIVQKDDVLIILENGF